MNKKILPSAYIGLILLGVIVSLCCGTEDLPSYLMSSRSFDANVKEQNEINVKNHHFLEEDQNDGKEGSTGKRSKTPHSLTETQVGQLSAMEKRKTKSEQEEKSSVQEQFQDEIRSNVNNKEFPMSKRLSQLLHNSRSMDFKNRPGFRSWGGKRTKFTTWGGKRSKFNNWGGKRSSTALNDDHPSSEELDNVVYLMTGRGFHVDYQGVPIGDERSGWLEKRDKFKSWGGKRNFVITFPKLKTEYHAQTRFSNWKGKRTDALDNMIAKRDLEYRESDDRDDGFVPEDKPLRDTFSKKEFQTRRGKRMNENLGLSSDSDRSLRGRSNFWRSFDFEAPVERSEDVGMKHFLMKHFRSRRILADNNSVLDRRDVLPRKLRIANV